MIQYFIYFQRTFDLKIHSLTALYIILKLFSISRNLSTINIQANSFILSSFIKQCEGVWWNELSARRIASMSDPSQSSSSRTFESGGGMARLRKWQMKCQKSVQSSKAFNLLILSFIIFAVTLTALSYNSTDSNKNKINHNHNN